MESAATCIINGNRPRNSPQYHPCSDDWGEVLQQCEKPKAEGKKVQFVEPVKVRNNNDPSEEDGPGASLGPTRMPKPEEFWEWVQTNFPSYLLPAVDEPDNQTPGAGSGVTRGIPPDQFRDWVKTNFPSYLLNYQTQQDQENDDSDPEWHTSDEQVDRNTWGLRPLGFWTDDM